MVRYIPIGNGKLLVSFNNDYNLTDIYFSREMAENHSGGRPFKYGISVDNNFVWMNKNFLISKDYFDHTMIGIAKYKISDVYFEDQNFVDIYEDIFVRKVKILNTTDTIKKLNYFSTRIFQYTEIILVIQLLLPIQQFYNTLQGKEIFYDIHPGW